MRFVLDWPSAYLELAKTIAKRSKDPNTQVGAVIVNADNRIIGLGYNGFVEGGEETLELWSDECKGDHVIHAEVNAIGNAARSGASTLGATIYLTLVPCNPCALTVAAAGIHRVVWPRASYEARIADKPHRIPIYEKAMHTLDRAGIDWEMV